MCVVRVVELRAVGLVLQIPRTLPHSMEERISVPLPPSRTFSKLLRGGLPFSASVSSPARASPGSAAHDTISTGAPLIVPWSLLHQLIHTLSSFCPFSCRTQTPRGVRSTADVEGRKMESESRPWV